MSSNNHMAREPRALTRAKAIQKFLLDWEATSRAMACNKRDILLHVTTEGKRFSAKSFTVAMKAAREHGITITRSGRSLYWTPDV